MRKGDVRLCVTHTSSQNLFSAPTGWDVKGGIPQNACWRLGGGEARPTLKHDRAIPKMTAVQFLRNAMKCQTCAQCNVAAWTRKH